MKPIVSLLEHRDYEPDGLADALRRTLEPLGGMRRFVANGSRVLLKPNLVFGRASEKAINTHPEIIRAVAREVWKAGASQVALGDSPGFGSCRLAAKGAGYIEAVREFDLELVEFTPTEHLDRSRAFVKLELAREALEADVIVNLPKMKTHGQMLMSLAVKNMFGAVPGARKLQWHYRAGRDRMLFARAINEIAMAVRPHLSILDAVVGMDGLGPSHGNPRPVGFLAASPDPWALDAAVMDVLGLERTLLFTLAAAAEHGPREWLELECAGDPPKTLRPEKWLIPELKTLQMHGGFVERRLPGVAKWLRSRISPRPVAKPSCRLCGYCVDICPAKAMRIDGASLVIDNDACIRCYCCHELCQYGGMDIQSGGILARMLGLSR